MWENNIYFERAFEEFTDFLQHSRLTPAEIRAVLDEIELANNKVHGYGSRNFGRNLTECYRRLCERDICPADLDRVMSFAERILEQPLELIDGVQETLEYLVTRHDLVLCTKGDPEEQKLKIERSGLAPFFGHTAIVKEKDAEAYRQLVSSLGWPAHRCWMIGNSPKSDIIPALEAGLGAVYVPHERTWHLERTEIPESDRLRRVNRFSDLQHLF